ncbi:hypothetical protein SAMN06298216_3873 [Spirosomataceae bacterium TFI 002]|nr:hypothetical protein SAMN06298216_3873 [Spirosomataceae bacterium TFI 002]
MILQSTVLKPYYRQNVGFYLLLYLLAFGFMRGEEHVKISGLVMSRLELLALVYLFWIAHVVKTSLFVNRTLSLPTHSFLRDFVFKNPLEQWKEFTTLQFYLNLPFISYGVFMLIIGIRNGDYFNVTVLGFLLLSLSIAPVLWLKYRFSNFLKTENASESKSWNLWPRTSHFWFLRYLLSREPFLFFSTKFFSFLIIMGLAMLYPTDDYDYRLIYLSAFFAGLGQFVIGKSYQQYIGEELWFTRNMAFSKGNLILGLLVNALIICAFELVLIFRYLPQDLGILDGLGACLLIFSFQFFWLTIGYLPGAFGETFSKRIYLMAAVFMLIVMYKVPVLILGGVLLLFGLFCLVRYYDLFELGLAEE